MLTVLTKINDESARRLKHEYNLKGLLRVMMAYLS